MTSKKSVIPFPKTGISFNQSHYNIGKKNDIEAASEMKAPTPKLDTADSIRLIVFADSSLSKALTKIADLYRETAPNISIEYRFDLSNTLGEQIKKGSACDIFISACEKKMNELDISAGDNTEGLDFIIPDTRVSLVGNKIALVVPVGNPAGVTAFDALMDDKVKSIGAGSEDTPIGHYTKELLIKLNAWDTVQRKLKLSSDTAQIAAWVDKGVTDCGILFSSDASSSGLKVIAFVTGNIEKDTIIYPAAVLKVSGFVAEAREFLDYLRSNECSAVFKSEGLFIP